MSSTLASRLPELRRNICRRCAEIPVIQLQPNRPRWISQKVVEKRRMGEEEWAKRAEAIEQGELQNIWDIFEERGYVKDVAGRTPQIKELLRTKRIGAYVGVDPTAASLHVGHLLPFMPLFWMHLHGYTAVSLVGGATGRIGDPTDRLKTREVMANSEVSMNITKIHYQLKKIWSNVEALGRKYGKEPEWAGKKHLVNNNMWWQGLPLYDVMKRLGRYMRIGPMLSRDTVKNKMEKGDGMSLAEFIYPLMQGWDFWHLYSKLGVQMQIGGSDQFGNIVTGIEAVKTIRSSEENPNMRMPDTWKDDPIGFTVPLLTDNAGTKFGKSAGNAVWLDPFMTSAFDLYGYFARRPDNEVEKLLKLFTFLPTTSIEKLMIEHAQDPPKRVAQHTLAFEVLSLVHGADVAIREQQQHQFMFSKGGNAAQIAGATGASEEGQDFLAPYKAIEGHPTTLNNAPKMDMQLPENLIYNQGIARILYAAGLASSVSEGHRIARAQGAYVAAAPGKDMRGLVPGNLDWTPVKLWYPQDVPKFLIDGRLLIIRKGKHNVRIIEVVSDEEWQESGKAYPGEPYKGKTRVLMQQLKEMAAAEGRKLSRRELEQMLKEKLAADEEEVTVANNPDIKFPKKSERQQAFGEGHKLQ
ncbi:tRNA synthetase class I [Colletotrichum graminicola]|uniref:Tyrosine--tRNA ligase n=1 Tax=Colletotrichum graminicola (strain M1.001 / M2 / FGSC 10212) TaxID=645133 RepID=E3Q4H3_COLGM|nr:tRNA synthetase class I [Colletotrichum graminicola M1.001]EFQ25485.1 tRNA synthetase class I [Colletotrichum graminicola M1.001]WDK11237.1 tRNA synthetase class I [Colletotrichum graminicola]